MDKTEMASLRAEVYAARHVYEQRRVAYERAAAPDGVWDADDLLEESHDECVNSEMDFRRGYLHGAREAVDHFQAMLTDRHMQVDDAYNALWDWHERDLAAWFQAAKQGDADFTPPPDPRTSRDSDKEA